MTQPSDMAVTPDAANDAEPARFDDGPKSEIRRGMIALGAFAAIFLVGGSVVPLDAAVTGSGHVVVAGNRQAVQHRDGGIVSALLVREGQEVKAGDVLMRIDVTELTSEERVLARQTIVARMLEARLQAQMGGKTKFDRPAWMATLDQRDRPDADSAYASQLTEFGATRKSASVELLVLRERSSQSKAEFDALDGQMEATRKQIMLTQDQLADIKELHAKGYAPLTRVRSLESSVAQLEGQLQGQLGAKQRLAGSMAEIAQQQQQLSAGRNDNSAEQLRQVQTDLLTLEPKLTAVREQIARGEVRATASGKVVGLTIFTVGGVISPGQLLMEIVPDDAPLVVEAIIRPTDAEAVRPGQKVQVRFTIAHARRAPMLFGEVVSVSADQFIDERSGQPYFKVRTALSAEEMARLHEVMEDDTSVGPGAPAEVVIPVRGRTALGYILDPLQDALWRNMREG